MNKNEVAQSSYSRNLGVTRECVRQLEATALRKLRRAFKKHLGPIETELPAAA
jgi:DNA-directed RNA polymerase sigma subunit (sigma70/sigma32)